MNELDLANPTSMAAYLTALNAASDADKEAEHDVNPNSLGLRLKLSKDTEMMALALGDQTQDSVRSLDILVCLPVGQRALFLPEGHPAKDEFKAPLCTTGMVLPSTLDKGVGSWRVNPHYPTPYLIRGAPTETEPKGAITQFQANDIVDIECNRCQWNQFGSEGVYNAKRPEARGKACKESRVWFFRILRKQQTVVLPTKEELGIYDFDQDYPDPVRVSLGFGSNKEVIEEIVLAAKARRLPFTSAVFRIGVRIERPSAGVMFPVLTYQFVGVPLPAVKESNSTTDLQWAKDFVARNPRAEATGEVEAPW